MLAHPAVARHYHTKVSTQLREASGHYATAWRWAESPFPFIGIHVLNTAGEACAGLLMDCSNYPMRSFAMGATDVEFRRFLRSYEVPPNLGQDGRSHLADGAFNKTWFCTPGTDEYHTFYRDVEPFDRIRGTPESDPVEVVNRCVGLIDRERLTKADPLRVPPPPAATPIL